MRAIGIILAGGNNRKMRELSQKRAIGAMPVAGSYRSIDFALSNMTKLKCTFKLLQMVGFRKKTGWIVSVYPCGNRGEQLLV